MAYVDAMNYDFEDRLMMGDLFMGILHWRCCADMDEDRRFSWRRLKAFVSNSPLELVTYFGHKGGTLLFIGLFLWATFDLDSVDLCPEREESCVMIGFRSDKKFNSEAKLWSWLCGAGIITAMSVYYAFYKRIQYAIQTSDVIAAELGRKNRQQRSLIDMKENEIKVMASSWKLSEDDLKLDEKTGEGSYGTVFKGRLHDTWTVAIKMFRKDGFFDNSQGYADDGEGSSHAQAVRHLDNISDEVKFLMRTRHPRLVMFVGFGVTKRHGKMFVVLEYMAGGELAGRIWHTAQTRLSNASARSGSVHDRTLSWSLRVKWLQDVAEALVSSCSLIHTFSVSRHHHRSSYVPVEQLASRA